MKIIAYTALLYGKDYLYYAIKSVIDYVDEYHVIYDATGHGSHGTVTERECPDTRWQLLAEANRAAGDKLRWHDDGPFANEGEQRDSIHCYAPDADHIIVLDADEIWQNAGEIIPYGIRFNARDIRVPIIHYWRSFNRAILHDPAYPVRIINTRFGNDEHVEVTPIDAGLINHMGYAQRAEIVEYKQYTHGHKGEWRQDDWFHTVFMTNAQTNCHPVGSDYWNPEPVDPWQYMPEFMKDHPFAHLEVIG